jgi:hypothetical protein
VYNPTTYGGSGYFDGSDYLTVSPPTFGTDSFTIEFWVYPTAATTTSWNPIMAMGASGGGQEIRISQNINGTGFGYLIPNNSNNADVFAGFGTLTLNTWHHIALVRNGSTVTFYRNGIALGSTTSVSFNFTNTGALLVGYGKYSGDGYFTGGYISDLRTTKGTAVYTTAFTPPTAPLTAITNTSLLLNMTNAGILDNAMMNDLETVGNAAVSTSVKKYGAASMYFDGSGDYLKTVDNPSLDMGSASFTIEGWVYVTATSGSLQTLVAKGTGADNQASYHIALNGSTWVYYLSGNGSTWSIASGVTIGTYTINTWQHIALVRNGSTFTPYLNGVAGTTTTSSTALFDSNKPFTAGGDDAGGSLLTGYIDELRVTKGVARYTATFTVPDQAFPNG